MTIVSEKNGTIERNIPETVAHSRFEDYCSNAEYSVTGDLYLFKGSRLVKEWNGSNIEVIHDDE